VQCLRQIDEGHERVCKLKGGARQPFDVRLRISGCSAEGGTDGGAGRDLSGGGGWGRPCNWMCGGAAC
jgi:hypothetical protein